MISNFKYLAKKANTATEQLKRGNYNYVVAMSVSQAQKSLKKLLPIQIVRSLTHLGSFKGNAPRFNALNAPVFKHNEKGISFPNIRAAVILDDFSMACWQGEFQTTLVEPDRWRAQLTDEAIDILFVESAHAGNYGSWYGKLKNIDGFNSEIGALVSWCKQQGIPTVIWNKEDPAHFEDFIETAKLFDVIFTTDSNMVAEYERLAPKARVDVLPFAAQPNIHNPARNARSMPGIRNPRWQKGDIVFAGTYFTQKFPERREQLDLLLPAAARAAEKHQYQFNIFSRQGKIDNRYRFPKKLEQYVVGSLPGKKMLSANYEHKVFLNVNSVVTSPSMCARRLFELPACGAAVVTTPNPATDNFFDASEVSTVNSPETAESTIITMVNSPELRERMVHRAQRKIWNNHCYSHRARTLLKAVNLDSKAPVKPELISVICSSNRPENITHLLEQFARQVNVTHELILVTHGFKISDKDFHNLVGNHKLPLESLQLIDAPSSWSLGECLNAAVEEAQGSFVAKFDDDDIYLPHYLEDMRNTVIFSDADLVGKQASYAYVEKYDALVLRRPECEHLWANFVAGPTLFGPRSTFANTPFEKRNTGEDTAFIKSVLKAGGHIYSSDRFNFIQVRGKNHTWRLSDEEFIAQGEVRTFGKNEEHVRA